MSLKGGRMTNNAPSKIYKDLPIIDLVTIEKELLKNRFIKSKMS